MFAAGYIRFATPTQDKLAVAEERSREINSAYDLIKEARSDVR